MCPWLSRRVARQYAGTVGGTSYHLSNSIDKSRGAATIGHVNIDLVQPSRGRTIASEPWHRDELPHKISRPKIEGTSRDDLLSNERGGGSDRMQEYCLLDDNKGGHGRIRRLQQKNTCRYGRYTAETKSPPHLPLYNQNEVILRSPSTATTQILKFKSPC